jgi:hypothetical protein
MQFMELVFLLYKMGGGWDFFYNRNIAWSFSIGEQIIVESLSYVKKLTN